MYDRNAISLDNFLSRIYLDAVQIKANCDFGWTDSRQSDCNCEQSQNDYPNSDYGITVRLNYDDRPSDNGPPIIDQVIMVHKIGQWSQLGPQFTVEEDFLQS